MEAAIEASELKKTYPPGGDGARRGQPIRGCGHDLRAAWAQRRRQVDDREGAVHAHAPGQRQRPRRRDRCLCDPAARAERSASSDRSTAPPPEATGRENLVLQGEFYGITGRDLTTARVAVARALRPRRTPPTGRRRRTRAGCSAGLTSRWACSTDRGCCSWMSRRPASTPRRGCRCGARSSGSPRDEGMTILLTTHYMEEADKLASRLAIIDRGRVVTQGHPSS